MLRVLCTLHDTYGSCLNGNLVVGHSNAMQLTFCRIIKATVFVHLSFSYIDLVGKYSFHRATPCGARSYSYRTRNSVRLSVSLSVCHIRGLSTRFDLWSWFLHHMVAPWFLFLGIWRWSQNSKGSPRATALNGGGVGTNWRFSTFKQLYLRNGARYDKR